MDRYRTRWPTALAVICLCGFAGYRGWEITQFVRTRAGLVAEGHQAGALDPWREVPGLARAAAEAQLEQIATGMDVDDALKRADILTRLLSVHPISAADWLSLAAMRLMAAQPYDTVLKALAMSWLTGPNEGNVMLRRGTFCLVQWEALPADARQHAIADLAGALRGTTVRDDEIAAAKQALSLKSADIRQQVSDMLRADGAAEAELSMLGL
jgi:hypothetical protein